MWLFVVLLNVVAKNSRFGGFNSRLFLRNSRFGLLREFAGNGLICLAIFFDEWQFSGPDRRNSRLHGNNREGCDRRIAWTICSGLIGVALNSAPNGESASQMALAMAAGGATAPP